MSDDNPHQNNGSNKKSLLTRFIQLFSSEPKNKNDLVDVLSDAQNRELINPETKLMIEGVLGVSEKTYYNIMLKSTLDQERSDRFQFIQSILESGEETFGTKANLSNWLNTPQPTLDGYTPKNMMSTITYNIGVYCNGITSNIIYW